MSLKTEMMVNLSEDGGELTGAIQNKRGNVNAEYQVVLQKQK